MLSRVQSFVLSGIDPAVCEVEVDVTDTGESRVTVVGLPDAAVKESAERVRSALNNSGYGFPEGRVLISLAPADVAKTGPRYDLPVAVGLLRARGVIGTDRHLDLCFAGELALDGRLRPVSGVINLALLARRTGVAGVVVPADNAAEAAAVGGVSVYPARTLADVVMLLNGRGDLEPAPAHAPEPDDTAPAAVDFGDIRGQEGVKRAMTVAAAGGHNILMVGPAGTGKSMSAKALPGILPPLTRDEALEVTRIYSAVGQVPPGRALITRRPVRSPHHTASPVSVVGGGGHPRPGEVSLAHHGVLFLDELPEFPRAVLETLRQPLEDGAVTIARARGSVRFPAQFQLVAAMNPTPKGDMPDDAVSRRAMDRYLAKLSGPMVDRIDIHVEVPRVPFGQLTGPRAGDDSATLRRRVVAARDRQAARNGGPGRTNRTLTGRELDRVAALPPDASELLKQAMQDLGLSARAYDKIRRVARTIADLDGADDVALPQVAEAVQYRLLDRDAAR